MWDREVYPQRFSQRVGHSPFIQSIIDRTFTVHCGLQLKPNSDCLPQQQRYCFRPTVLVLLSTQSNHLPCPDWDQLLITTNKHTAAIGMMVWGE